MELECDSNSPLIRPFLISIPGHLRPIKHSDEMEKGV